MVEISAPFVVGIQITGQCNLSCKYCYASGLDDAQISATDLERVLDELSEVGVFQILFEGGEPLLHPDFIKLVEYALDRFPTLAILTNGSIIDNRTLERLAELNKNYPDLNVQVSLDSHIASVNDLTRDRGGEVLKNIDKFLAFGFDIALATVVTSHNVRVADLVIDFFFPRVRRFHYMNIMPSSGNGIAFERLRCEPVDAQRLWDVLDEKRRKLGVAISYPCDKINSWMGKSTIQASNCLAGIARAYITPNLDLVACNIADRSVMGNLRTHRFSDIWRSARAEQIRNASLPACHALIKPDSPAVAKHSNRIT